MSLVPGPGGGGHQVHRLPRARQAQQDAHASLQEDGAADPNRDLTCIMSACILLT